MGQLASANVVFSVGTHILADSGVVMQHVHEQDEAIEDGRTGRE